MPKKTIVFILSTNYAGSHYLSLLLGSNSRAEHLGEVKNMAKNTRNCFICGSVSQCKLFKGIETVAKDKIYETLFSRVAPEVDVLVDNSKKLEWVQQFLPLAEYELKFIHLIRDPRALVRRWLITYTTFEENLNQRLKLLRMHPENFLSFVFGSQVDAYIKKWVYLNESISQFINNNHLDGYVITYRDLVKNTAEELTSLNDWLGLQFEPEQVNYWQFQHHGTQKKDYEWVKEKKEQYFDLRWREYFSDAQQQKIAGDRQVQNYLKQLGLLLKEDGLVKTAK